MSVEKCHSEDVSKVNRKPNWCIVFEYTSVLRTNSLKKNCKMGRNLDILNLSMGNSSTSESIHWITASSSLLIMFCTIARIFYHQLCLVFIVSEGFFKKVQTKLTNDCKLTWREMQVARSVFTFYNVLLVALKRSRTVPNYTQHSHFESFHFCG